MAPTFWRLALVITLSAALGACSSDGDDAPGTGSPGPSKNPFVGTWHCAAQTNSGSAVDTTLKFSENADGSLSSTFTLSAWSCNLSWTASNDTATAAANQLCTGERTSMTVNSSTFELDGSTGNWNADVVVHGINVNPDGSETPIDVAGSVSATCTRS